MPLDAFGVHGAGGTLGALLTGVFATSAINEGAIYKFLTKPWNDDSLRRDVRHAFRLNAEHRVAA